MHTQACDKRRRKIVHFTFSIVSLQVLTDNKINMYTPQAKRIKVSFSTVMPLLSLNNLNTVIVLMFFVCLFFIL